MRRKAHQLRRMNAKGFSIIELLVAVIIIGILATILIPIIANRSQQARLARAESDLERIADAIERVAVDTGYYPRIWMLSYSIGATGNGPFQRFNGATPVDTNRGVRDIGTGGWFQGIPNRLFILPSTHDWAPNSSQLLTNLQGNETDFGWYGPYLTWNRDRNLTGGLDGADGIPDDPWGNNYLFFLRTGLVQEPIGEIVTSASLPIGSTQSVGVSNLDRFDRPTVISLGPDGLPGSGGIGQIGTGDDIVRQFGY